MNRIVISLLCICCLLSACESQERKPAPKAGTPAQSDQPSTTARPRADDWRMFMYDLQFSGQSPDQSLKPPLKLRWKFKTGGKIEASPVIANGVVYVGSSDRKFYALDAKTWGLKWAFTAGGAIRYAAAVWNNRVYFSGRDNHVYALDAETGELVWKFHSETWMDSPPIVADGQVYIGAFTRKIHVLDAETGALIAQPNGRTQINGIDYACTQGQLRPISPTSQVEFWRRYTPYTYSFPVIANGVVYIGARDNRIHAVDTESKQDIWSYETKGFVDAAPAIAGGILYVTSHDGYVYAFDNQNAGEATPPPDPRPVGTVAHDGAPVYTAQNSGSDIKLRLNDGVELPIINQAEGWYQVELPNGEVGWMNRFGVGTFEGSDGVAFNTAICSTPRTLELVEGGEVPRWSPNGQVLAFLKRTDLSDRYWEARELWITDSRGKNFHKLCTGRFYNPHLSWSLDSNFIAFEAYEGKESHVWIFDRRSGRLIKLVQGDAPEWSPVANQIAFRRWEEGTDIVYRLNSDQSSMTAIARIPIKGRIGSFIHLDPPAWSPDGSKIAIAFDHQHYSSAQARLRIHDPNGNKLEEILTQSQRIKQIEWSADGSKLAYVLVGNPRPDPVLDKRLHVVDMKAPAHPKILKHTAPSWSPEGNRLAYLEREDCMGLQWKVWILDLETNQRFPIARTTIDLNAIKWLPDGKHLCLWHTSSYLRDGKYKPAQTTGWIVALFGQ